MNPTTPTDITKFAIYHREREWAREMGDPKLAEIEAPSKEEAERLTAHLGSTGTIAIPIVACAHHVSSPSTVSTLDTQSPLVG